MALGLPALVVPRVGAGGLVDQRALAAFCQNVALRIAAIERVLNATSDDLTVQQKIQGLINQPDGLVYKRAGQLLTCGPDASSGLDVSLAGTTPRISVPFLEGLADGPDGLLAKSGDAPLEARVLVVASGTVLTITNDDGAAGDPTFSIP